MRLTIGLVSYRTVDPLGTLYHTIHLSYLCLTSSVHVSGHTESFDLKVGQQGYWDQPFSRKEKCASFQFILAFAYSRAT